MLLEKKVNARCLAGTLGMFAPFSTNVSKIFFLYLQQHILSNPLGFFLFFSRFEVERSLNCAYDYVTVFNGPSKSHPELGKYCGAFLPADVKSTSNRMLIMFHSDGSTQRSGFFALFQSVAPQLAGTGMCAIYSS